MVKHTRVDQHLTQMTQSENTAILNAVQLFIENTRGFKDRLE